MSHRILIVDDDLEIREAMIEVLEESGHRTYGAANGFDALAQLRQWSEPPCLIFLDLMMPGMDGRTFREEQLKDPTLSPIPVVLLSAAREVAEAAEQLQVAGHVRKPIRLDDLLALVDNFCEPDDALPTTS